MYSHGLDNDSTRQGIQQALPDHQQQSWTSLVTRRIGIHLPMQGTQSLLWEDSTCYGATKPVPTNTEACELRAPAPQEKLPVVRSPLLAMKSSPRLPRVEKGCAKQQGPTAAKNK